MKCITLNILIAFIAGNSDKPVDVMVQDCGDNKPNIKIVRTGERVKSIDSFVVKGERILIVEKLKD